MALPEDAGLDRFIANGAWRLPHPTSAHMHELWPRIRATHIHGGDDTLTWRGATTGTFDMGVAWHLVRRRGGKGQGSPYRSSRPPRGLGGLRVA